MALVTDGTAPTPVGSDALAIVTFILAELGKLEARIMDRLDENSRGASARWSTHQVEHQELVTLVTVHQGWIEAHDQREADQRLVFDARVKPVRTIAQIIWRQRATIAVILLLAADLTGRVLEAMGMVR